MVFLGICGAARPPRPTALDFTLHHSLIRLLHSNTHFTTMRTSRAAEQTLRAATLSRPPKYVCRACRAQAARQFHTSIRNHADIPFFQRLQQQLFGSKEAQQAEKSREEKRVQQAEDLKQRGNVNQLEVKVAKNGQQYEVAAVVVPNETTDYVQALHGKELERVGSEAWVKARADQGEQYAG